MVLHPSRLDNCPRLYQEFSESAEEQGMWESSHERDVDCVELGIELRHSITGIPSGCAV